ncbi:MAG: hypothetical protein EA416_04810 [Trueperaceae bacterium]|nr:MAG: hypothetical protein EA416_04810 [Trueperaceae bacterium]
MTMPRAHRTPHPGGVGGPRSAVRAALTTAVWCALTVAATASAQAALSYLDAVSRAGEGPTVHLAERALELAERQLAVTAAPVRGELTAGYRWTGGERDPGFGERIDLTDQGFDPVALTLSFPALGLGPAGDAIDRARADVARAHAELAAARRAALIDVTSAFQSALRARASVELAHAEAELAALELRAADLRAAAGAATASEVARLAAAETRLRNAVTAAEFEATAAQRSLELALGGPVPPPAGPLPEPTTLLDGVTVPAWRDRSDVLAAQLALADTERSAAATLRDQLPSLGVSVAHASGDDERTLQLGAAFDTRTQQPTLSIGYDPDTGVPGFGDGGSSRSLTLGITLRVPLDPTVGSALAAARIARERAELQLELTSARAELDVERRDFELASALADADLARAAADLAHADLAVAEARFASGALSELALARARLDAARADLDADRAADAARLAALRLLDALAADPDRRPAHRE